MLTLDQDRLTISFPEIHPDAVCHIDFQRTLRIPDDNRTHNLPPGLGKFPLAHVDDFADKLPAKWQKRGGVFLPMHQAEAMWIRFHSRYPFAVKIAAGKINAVTGKQWTPELNGPQTIKLPSAPPFPRVGETVLLRANNEKQDYLSVPDQPWLDGFSVGKGKIRQFVAMPLGEGYTVEEQLTGEAIHGGLQIIVYPLKPQHYRRPMPLRGLMSSPAFGSTSMLSGGVGGLAMACASNARPDMGMAPGGLMKQTIHEDSYGIEKFDQSVSARCFVHLLNSQQYERVTGRKPPHRELTAADYTSLGLPWFGEPDNSKALPGSDVLSKLDSVANLGNKLGQSPLDSNSPLPVAPKVVQLNEPLNQVRQGEF